MISRDKVRGMLMGVSIGDALGMPVEMMKPANIKAKYPDGIRGYMAPDGHKWFNGNRAGTWTDDTQLTLAVIDGLIDAGTFDLDAQARTHVDKMKDVLKTHGPSDGGSGVPGWGRTTADSVRRLANGVSWKDSADRKEENAGHGNGVVMRIAPLAAWYLSPKSRVYGPSFNLPIDDFNQRIVDFSAMTHFTKKSAIASVMHTHALMRCLQEAPDTYNLFDDLYAIIDQTWCWLQDGDFVVDYLNGDQADIFDAMDEVPMSQGWSSDEIYRKFGGGSCNVAHSLPFTYAYWLKDHKSVQLLYSIVEAGGDTDSNASMAGAMLGALHGMSVFPEHLLAGLDDASYIMARIDEFCDIFGIN